MKDVLHRLREDWRNRNSEDEREAQMAAANLATVLVLALFLLATVFAVVSRFTG